ncbi:MAG: bifunctional diguanylate cyclase/phosphodiesterase [Comamonadaceae bacterium]|nr:MAG: bifunctional diguanylate cyclase/phosphodiesterase [Comamonadaceae bacterium]
MQLLPRSLLNRVFLLYAVVLSIMMFGGLGLSLRGQLTREIEDANDTANMVIEITAQAVADAAVVNDLEAISRTLAAGVNRTPFGSARYLEVDGHELRFDAPPHRSIAPPALRALVAERLSDVNRVVEVGGRDYGVLRLSFSVDGVADYLWATLFNTLLFAGSALAVGLIVTRALLSRWLSHLGTLQSVVEQVQAGELDALATVSVNAPEEVRRTLEQFNWVANQFRDRFGQRIGTLTHSLVQHKRATDEAVIVIELDPEGRVLYANDLHAQVSGWTREAFICRQEGWSLDIELYRAHARQSPLSVIWKGEVACARSDGATVWVRRAVVPIRDESGGTEKYICLDIDISAEKLGELTLKQEKKRAEVTLHSIADGVITVDMQRRVNYANLAAERILGETRHFMEGLPLDQVLPIPACATTGDLEASGSEAATTRITLNDGRSAVIELSRAPLQDEQGSLAGEVLAFRDVTQEHAIHRELKRASLAVRHAASAILTTDQNGCIEYVNPGFTSMTGFGFEEVCGRMPSFLKSATVPQETYSQLWATLRKAHIWRGEMIICRKAGADFWCGMTVSAILDAAGQPVQYVAVMEDTTARKLSEDTIHRLAFFDSLTSLPNRRMFMEHAGTAIEEARVEGKTLFACYLDLDGFKNINDSLGHHVGDQLLAEVALRLAGCIGAQDFVGRIGGDEFALLLPGATKASASTIGNLIIQKLDAPFSVGGHDISISTSIGVSVFPDDGVEVADLLRRADMALYRAKESGKRKVVFFTCQIETEKLEHTRLEFALRGALQRGELRVVYQPKVRLAGQTVVGAEALMRWRHPELGEIEPSRFIPIAEDSRLIIPMGLWILDEACRQIRAWTDLGMSDVTIAVNIAAVQFRTPNLAREIEGIVRSHGIDPRHLELEVTESGLVEDPESMVRILSQLRAIGLSIAIDDFGTGYSSLAYLKTFPVSVLKIDRSFVRDLETDLNDKGIAEAIVSMAKVLGLNVVAEGVENEAQAAILLHMGCEMAQGYFFGRPMTPESFEAHWRAVRIGPSALPNAAC